ncbi:uncharacterized protein LOC116166154 [Photinus pyralis]|uniref:uncharacterized protein LOC116159976 n=1 Tax=Photinus pyralis TaxID=7054 RepID=UPI001266F55C|nr:uncharacterized protein LOC116159976 [Photinus pyralis]XP_031336877.1 uncharacterized protein LOC116166154 [Photinus pyralis]
MAGKDWYYHFLKRNKVISLRKPEPTSINRISAFNETQVNQFFQNLKKLYEKYHFSNEKIFNVDETGISTMQKPSKRVGPKGIKQFGAKTSAERGKTVTVICCFNAAGTCYVPPMFIFPRTRTTTLEKNGPPNAKYSCSKSGWSNEQLFYEWLQHFIDIVKPSKDHPVLIILDNHSSHISIAIYECCKQNGIVLLTIPPHTSHRLQPLDLTFYGPLKAAFYRQCDNYLLHFERITPYDLAELFHKAYSQVATMDKAQSGFKTPGIWPFDSEKFTKEDFLASNHHTPTVTIDEEPQNDPDMRTTTPEPSISEVFQEGEPSTSTAVVNEIAIKSGSGLPQPEVSFEDLNPIPTPSTSKIQRRKKQKSEILTETPNKQVLIVCEEKRNKRSVAFQEKLKRKSKKGKSSLKHPAKNKQNFKRNLFQESEPDESISESELCDDDELDDMDGDSEDRCLICDDSSKKDEYWFRCILCSRWAHELCSGVDSAEGYVCDFCDR